MADVLRSAKEAAAQLPEGWTVEVLWSPLLNKNVGWVMKEAGMEDATNPATLQRRSLGLRAEEAMRKNQNQAVFKPGGGTARSDPGQKTTTTKENKKDWTDDEERGEPNTMKHATVKTTITREVDEMLTILVLWEKTQFRVSVHKHLTMRSVMTEMKRRSGVSRAMFLNRGEMVWEGERADKYGGKDSAVEMVGMP